LSIEVPGAIEGIFQVLLLLLLLLHWPLFDSLRGVFGGSRKLEV
jgi:hypothetical protein